MEASIAVEAAAEASVAVEARERAAPVAPIAGGAGEGVWKARELAAEK